MNAAALPAKALFPDGLCGLIFDVDGVLFDSKASNTTYYNLIRSAVGLPPLSAEEEAFCHMSTVREALQRIIPENRRVAAEIACRQINYQERILPLLKPEPGLLEALHWLKQWDIRTALCTNRTNSVDALLRCFGLESFFWPVKTAANSEPKPNPMGLVEIMQAWGTDATRVAFLGDSGVDRQAAEAVDISFWAFRNETLKADLHVSDFFELITWLSPLVERT